MTSPASITTDAQPASPPAEPSRIGPQTLQAAFAVSNHRALRERVQVLPWRHLDLDRRR